ncbi:hypothetical protein F5882DRAFT_406164 [Hyaloscypha sp. PMI_1271]|nr:hypothetical protein F5882DRAFT_406164 [Hyaloscypha sp. PMI_1271]
MALSTLALVLAMGLGPVLGGAINIKGDWCWVFLINIPPGTASIVLLHAYTRGRCG